MTVCSVPATAHCPCCGNSSPSTHKSICWPTENQTSSFCLHSGHHNRKKQRMLNLPHNTYTSTMEQVKGEENGSIKQLSDVSHTEPRDSPSPTRDICPNSTLASSVQSVTKPSTPAETMQQCPNKDQRPLLKPGTSMETSPSEIKDGISLTSTGVQSALQQPDAQSAAQFQVAPPQQAVAHFRSAMDTVSPESPASVCPSQTRTLSLQGLHGWIPFQVQMDVQGSTSIPMRFYQQHFRHRPLHAPSIQDKSQSEGAIGHSSCALAISTKLCFCPSS